MSNAPADISSRLARLETRHDNHAETLEELDELVRGESLNLRDRVLILWHSQLWVLALSSFVVGAVVQKLLGLL